MAELDTSRRLSGLGLGSGFGLGFGLACTRGGLDHAGTSCLGLSLERRPTSGFGGGAAWFANQLPPPLRAWAAARGEAAGAAAEGSGRKPNASMACA